MMSSIIPLNMQHLTYDIYYYNNPTTFSDKTAAISFIECTNEEK